MALQTPKSTIILPDLAEIHAPPADAPFLTLAASCCASRAGGRCNYRPSYQAQVWSARARKPIRKTFPMLSDARTWRTQANHYGYTLNQLSDGKAGFS